MLNRRILRVKAFQNLYAFEQCKASNYNLSRDFIKESFQPDLNSMEVQDKAALNREAELALSIFEKNLDNTKAIDAADASPKVKQVVKEAIVQYRNANKKDQEFLLKNMVTSAERIPQLYLLAIELLQAFAAHVGREHEKKRKLAGESSVEFAGELNLYNNQVLKKLRNSPSYQAALAKNNVNLDDVELEIKEWFRDYIKPSEEYQAYLKISNPSLEQDLEAAEDLLKKILFKNEVILNYFSEKDLNWTENKSVVRSLAAKVLKNAVQAEESGEGGLPEIAMNWEEDKEFFQNIFNFTIEKDQENRELIAQKTKNWDIDRLAFTDKVIISMAITEMQLFPSIPVKVSINEYIDISKTYSTPKSKQFVNGLLDVMSRELTEQGKIRKSGRGLLDNK
ncbi:transcription antitermination factor NusB [Algoriphagus limi]|uniref:Transcription antitermination factor NusB n=1 Tax=Algoriphagus limi TaxID=2975273 RepID=A0ABT2G5X9_9BACT|nr:transcription antitermination factor NusB [Algoriphagus limi]MCS5490665.1 transcription antitermination factor NusB [Algoriphagus limi]